MDELATDLEAFEESMTDLEGAVDRISTVADEDGSGVEEDDLARAWFDTVVEHRVKGLLLTDIRWELNERRAPAAEGPEGAAIEERLEGLADRHRAVGDRLDDLTSVAWVRRHAADLSALDRDLAELQPPIDWGALGELLDTHVVDPEDAE